MAQRRADWRVGVYVRVHGHLRSFENKKSMVVFSLKVIHDFNEVSQKLCAAVLPILCQLLSRGLPTHVLQTCGLAQCVFSSQAHTAYALQVSFHFLQCIFHHVHLARGQSGSMVSTSDHVLAASGV